ncbi:MAG TPA: hypothetical protein P5102_18195 [Candidatus Competibacteraceae bacterium]|nr:hypothetical protein [Candidatus Competibacteraceae bacterium]HRZ08032.1 hypothetical protein [Candidatus Competibacteraceae bacterium]HSA48154.1 hypothetical protein [Candidatus Competibacteraceae bacterium]
MKREALLVVGLVGSVMTWNLAYADIIIKSGTVQTQELIDGSAHYLIPGNNWDEIGFFAYGDTQLGKADINLKNKSPLTCGVLGKFNGGSSLVAVPNLGNIPFPNLRHVLTCGESRLNTNGDNVTEASFNPPPFLGGPICSFNITEKLNVVAPIIDDPSTGLRTPLNTGIFANVKGGAIIVKGTINSCVRPGQNSFIVQSGILCETDTCLNSLP